MWICKLATVVEGDSKAPFPIATKPFPGLLHFTLDTYLILLSIKKGGTIFLSVWYDATWDWTQLSQTNIEDSTH